MMRPQEHYNILYVMRRGRGKLKLLFSKTAISVHAICYSPFVNDNNIIRIIVPTRTYNSSYIDSGRHKRSLSMKAAVKKIVVNVSFHVV